MKFTEKMVISQVGDAWFAVSVGSSEGSTSKMVKLNCTGKEIFDGIMEGKTTEEIAFSLMDKYEIDREKAENSVNKVISTLIDKGVLTDVE